MRPTPQVASRWHPPVRVLQMFGAMEPGGAELRLLDVLGRLPRNEFRVDVCSLSGQAGSLDDAVRAHGGEVIPLRLDGRFPARFVRLLRQGRYTVVHSNVLLSSGPILSLARLAKVPVRVAHFHATQDGYGRSARRQWQRRICGWRIGQDATDIVACGEGVMDAIWGPEWRDDRRCRVIPAAVDVDRFERLPDGAAVRADLGIPDAAPVLMHLGRESADDVKNHRRVLAIFAAVRRERPDAWLVLAGAGTDAPDGATGRALREFGIREQVRPLGVRRDVPALLAAADLLLLPSKWEGLPGVVLEAAAAGLPVLGSDIPGVREIAAHLSQVRPLSLDADDPTWARHALVLAAEARQRNWRAGACDRVRASVFGIDYAVHLHRRVWLQGSRVPA